MSESSDDRIKKVYEGKVLVGVTYQLLFPIESQAGDKITELHFKRPKNKHMKHMGSSPTMEDLHKLGAKLSGMMPKDFDELDAADGIEISGIISDFLDVGQQTGRS